MQKNIEEISKAHIIVIGDTMLDIYYEGDASRISPEAPVPVVLINKKRELLGGAGNVAKNISTLGAKCTLISIIGDDENGNKIKNLLDNAQIKNQLICSKEKCSTVKSRIFARNQQMLRYDEENIQEINDIEKKQLLTSIKENLKTKNTVIILSDYGKGLIYKDLIQDIYTLASENNCEKPKILIDPKPINKNCYENAFIMTPNTKEASELSNIKGTNKQHILKMATLIQKHLKTENLLITLGGEGMALFTSENIYHIKSTAKQVFDVTGAGDTVIAILAIGIANKYTLKEACILASLGAGIVVEKVGSASTTQEELLFAYHNIKTEVSIW